MADKNWTTNYPTNLDTNTNMPTLAPGDTGLITQPNALKDAVIQIESVLGSDSLEVGSIRKKVEDLESNSATKTLLDSYATLVQLANKADLILLDSYASKILLDSYATTAALDDKANLLLLDSYAQLSHHTQHESGGSDAIKLDDLATPDDNTDLNATITYHGLLPKLSNISTEFLNGQGSWATPAGGGGSGLVDGYLPLPELLLDPTSNDNYGNLYTKQDDSYGTTELFYQDSLGQVTQITQDGYLATYNSLRGVRLLTGTNFIADSNSVILYAKNVSGVSELFIKDDLQNDIQVTSNGSVISSPVNVSQIDGYISFIGNELDPATTTGSETQLVLDFSPVDDYALAVYRNGLLMRKVISLSDDYQEYTLADNVIEFLPTNVAGDWYFAQTIDAYSRFGALVDGVLQLPDTTDPVEITNVGQLYSKQIDGYSELHYQDDYGLVTQITNKGNAIGGGGGGIALDTTYSSAFSGAKSVYDYSLNKLTLGYEDEFPGVALGSRWTTSLGSDGSVAVASNAVQITDGITGTDAVYAYIVAADNPGWEVTVHITNNGSATSTAGGLWVWDNLAVTRFAYIQLQGGTVWYGYGPATFNNTAVGASAQWFKLRYNGNAFTWFRHTNAHTSEPTIENWTFIATTSVTGYYLAPQQIRLQVDASGANVADYSFRHFRLRYL